MNTYIVLDLEWNQSDIGKAGSIPGLPFEIIEIGAVKLDSKLEKIGEFRKVIRPVAYERLHFRVLEIVNIGIEELRKEGESFASACREFIDWCYADGERPVFCTWGEADLVQLQRNMKYHGVDNPFPYPFLYYDLQKLYAIICTGNKRNIAPLDRAVEELDIRSDEEFHRALADANYTALVMKNMGMEKAKKYFSVDYYRLPEKKKDEIYLLFPDYSKYVSRAFDTKEEMMEDETVTSIICYRCNRRLKKKIRWFTPNQRHYYAVAYCPEHGYIKGKIRVKHTEEDKVFTVKTIKMISEDTAMRLAAKKTEVSRIRHEKNKLRLQKKHL